MPIKSIEMKILREKFFLMSQGLFKPKIKFLGQKVCFVAGRHINRQTHTRVNTEDALSGFQEFVLQAIIKDRSNILASYLIAKALFLIVFFNY